MLNITKKPAASSLEDSRDAQYVKGFYTRYLAVDVLQTLLLAEPSF